MPFFIRPQYSLGPSAIKFRLSVESHEFTAPIPNVVATIPGATDEAVVLGNHRDAWVFGAADPNSGTAAMLEVGRGLGQLLSSGWKPRRTIYICSWST